MRRFLWAVFLLLPVLAQSAFADSIPTLSAQATMPFLVNFSGENQGFTTFNGPDVGLTANGGDVVCFSDTQAWCMAGVSFSPGSSLTPSIDLVDFSTVQGGVRLGGKVHPAELGIIPESAITALSGFTFPTSGKGALTVSVPATLNGAHGSTLDGSGDFNLEIPPGMLVLTFDFFPGHTGSAPVYAFSKGVFTTSTVPEPGALGLMVSGLGFLIGAVRKKLTNTSLPDQASGS